MSNAINLEVTYDGITSDFDVSNYTELKVFACEDFIALNGKEFQFYHEVDGKKTVISNERTFSKFVSKYGGKGEDLQLTILTVDQDPNKP